MLSEIFKSRMAWYDTYDQTEISLSSCYSTPNIIFSNQIINGNQACNDLLYNSFFKQNWKNMRPSTAAKKPAWNVKGKYCAFVFTEYKIMSPIPCIISFIFYVHQFKVDWEQFGCLEYY